MAKYRVVRGPSNDFLRIYSYDPVDAWHAPAFAVNWSNYSAAEQPAGYVQDPFGFVHLRGLVKVSAGTAPLTVFLLPTALRPKYKHRFIGTSNGTYCRIAVSAAGEVEWTSGGDAVSYLCLDGITFDVR